VKLVVAASGDVDWLPSTALAPLQPPEAVQLVAFVELQVKVDAAPLAMMAGLAVSATVGGGGGTPTETVTDWLEEPPAPVQVNV
jgi:hypothetical protein